MMEQEEMYQMMQNLVMIQQEMIQGQNQTIYNLNQALSQQLISVSNVVSSPEVYSPDTEIADVFDEAQLVDQLIIPSLWESVSEEFTEMETEITDA
jgi:hypothetical protein